MIKAEIGFAYAEDVLKLCGTGVCTEINQIGNGSLLDTHAIVLVVVFQIESQVSSGLKVIVPAEMVRRVVFLKPVGALPLDFRIKGGVTVVLGSRTQELFPLSLEVEIADLIAQRNEFALSGDACRLEQVDDDATVDTQLVVVARK